MHLIITKKNHDENIKKPLKANSTKFAFKGILDILLFKKIKIKTKKLIYVSLNLFFKGK